MGETWERLLTLVGFGFWVFDYVTDIGTLISYRRKQSMRVARLATASMTLSTVVGIGITLRSGYLVKKGIGHDDRWIIFLKCLEAMVESIPQLIINLYVLSSCMQDTPEVVQPHAVDSIQNATIAQNGSTNVYSGADIPTIQYISLVGSFIGICIGVVNYDKMLFKGIFIESMEWLKNSGLLRFKETYYVHVKSSDWLELFLLFLTKSFAIVARISILVFFVFNLKWWIAFFVAFHCICILFFGIGVDVIDGDFKRSPSYVRKISQWFLLFAIWLQFVWTMDGRKWFTMLFAICYSIENIVLLAVSLNFQRSDDFCLYDNVLLVNVGLSVACLFFAFLFTIKRRREDTTCERITKQIGEWTKQKKNVFKAFICCEDNDIQTSSLRPTLPNLVQDDTVRTHGRHNPLSFTSRIITGLEYDTIEYETTV